MLVRRAVFAEVDGFDTDHFFLYCDDVDLSWRTRLIGHRVVHVPTALVFHDKRITAEAAVEATESEDFFGLLGRLMLAHRYDRSDVLAETLAYAQASGTPGQVEAVAEYHRRHAAGRVPSPLPGAEHVAEFIGGNYSTHRF